MKTRAVIYARYSTDLQSESSLADQIDLCKRYAKRQGWKVVQAYEDAAISGTTHQRPGYQRLLKDIAKEGFDVLLAEAIDRLSRDQEDLHALVRRLRYHGVEMHTCADGKVGSIHLGFKGYLSQQVAEDISLKTLRGLAGRVRAGKSGGGRCYGYDVVREVRPDGSLTTGERRVNAEQAKVVRRIFEEYADGVSPKVIARRLNQDGIASPRGGTWTASTLVGNAAAGNGVLNNELYIGKLVWNRSHSIKHPETRRKTYRLNPESEWVVTEVPEQRIVPDELWNKVAAMKAKLRERMGPLGNRKRFNRATRPRFLLSGKVKCAQCGGNYISHNAGWWRCGNHVQRRTCGNDRGIRRSELEERVFGAVNREMLQAQPFRRFIEELGEAVRKLRAGVDERRAGLAKRLAVLEEKIGNVVAAVEQGQAFDSLVERLGELEAEKMRLQEEAKLTETEVRAPSPDMAGVYAAKVRDLIASLGGGEGATGVRETVREMIETVTITPTPRRQPVGVTIRGNLLSALRAGQPATPENTGDAASWFQTLAGVGFEPTTFRL